MPIVNVIEEAHVRGVVYEAGETYEVTDDHAQVIVAYGWGDVVEEPLAADVPTDAATSDAAAPASPPLADAPQPEAAPVAPAPEASDVADLETIPTPGDVAKGPAVFLGEAPTV